jgi:pyridinium-3,5-bisthiocarboxylic acid mononucleotide nickel chelatase
VHGVEPDAVHFHEVGALDSIADIVGVAAALHGLQIESLSCGRIAVGSGEVRAAHGTMPVPVPAVVELATGWRVYAGGAGELTTPTGMALVAALAETSEELPLLDLRGAGCGAGSRDTPDRPNVTRVLVGTRPAAAVEPETALETAVLLETNVDDLDPRLWPGVLASLLDAGAADAWLVPIIMKKGRPAHTLSVLAQPARVASLRDLVLARTSTIGVRETTVARTVLARGWVDVSLAGVDLPVKIAYRAGVIWQATPEFDELDRAAVRLARPPQALLAEALSAIHFSGLVAGAAVPPGLRTSREPRDQSGVDPGSTR